MRFPISIKSYNITAQRAAFDTFNALTADAKFINSAVLFEEYCLQSARTPVVSYNAPGFHYMFCLKP